MYAAIGNAFAVLSDSQKRKRYDDYGTDEPELRRRGGHSNGFEYDYSHGFEGKFRLQQTRLSVPVPKAICACSN